jgi:Domain of unknown function (DUF4349)
MRPTSMNSNIHPAPSRAGLRITALSVAAVMSGAGLLLAGCSAAAPASSASGSGASASSHAPSAVRGTAGGAEALPAAEAGGGGGQPASVSTTGLIVPGQSIIYTAGLTVRAANVATAASLATSIVTAAGGYVASEQATIRPAGHTRPAVSLQLKIPVAAYGATLRQLAGRLGSQTALSQRAQDVTGQVADVTSRVASAKAAITQLRALLKRAGSVGGLLGVQDQINAEESQLEALQAQQRALAHETTYATVSLRLVSKHGPSVVAKRRSHGFLAGLSAGWRALRSATSWLLTAAGTVLPFAVIAALAGGIALGGRRRVLRRRADPTTAG